MLNLRFSTGIHLRLILNKYFVFSAVSCPSDRIYEACKPGCDKQCTHYVSEQECEAEEAVEGCFCPPGTVQLNGDCVDEDVCTNCVDDDGTVYEVCFQPLF